MSTDGVLGAVWLPTDGWLDPSGLTLALAAGARAARGADPDAAPGSSGIGVERGRVTGVTVEHDGERSTIAAEVVVNAADVRARDRRGWPASTCRSSRWPTSTCSPSRSRASTPGLPQLRDPDNLVYFREEVGGLCMGGYERDPAPWSLDGIPPDFNGKLLRARLAALRGDHGRRRPARAGHRRRRDHAG